MIAAFLDAAHAAATAVRVAIAGLRDDPAVGIGADGAPTEAADAAAEAAALAALRPLGVPIVSEEAGLVDGPLDPGGPWISLDPLDGSRNFVAGYAPYGIAIALMTGTSVIAGFVADLAGDVRWWSDGEHAFRDGTRIRARRGSLMAMPSPAERAVSVRAVGGISRLRIAGSSAVDSVRVADGSVAAFVSADRAVTHVHDVAASSAIVAAAGGVVVGLDAKPLAFVPDPLPTLRFIAAADAELVDAILQHVRTSS